MKDRLLPRQYYSRSDREAELLDIMEVSGFFYDENISVEHTDEFFFISEPHYAFGTPVQLNFDD